MILHECTFFTFGHMNNLYRKIGVRPPSNGVMWYTAHCQSGSDKCYPSKKCYDLRSASHLFWKYLSSLHIFLKIEHYDKSFFVPFFVNNHWSTGCCSFWFNKSWRMDWCMSCPLQSTWSHVKTAHCQTLLHIAPESAAASDEPLSYPLLSSIKGGLNPIKVKLWSLKFWLKSRRSLIFAK